MNTTFSKNFGWEIERHPISFERNGELITDPDFQILSRNDSDKVLSVMSKKYCPMTVEEFEKATERMQEVSGMKMMGYQEFNDGKILLSILKNGDPLTVNSYPIEDYLVMGTSFKDRQAIYSNFELMQNFGVTDEDKRIFVNQVLTIPEVLPEKGLATRTLNRREDLMKCIEGETAELGNNLFGLFQGLTKFTTHSLQTRKEAPFANLIGTANDLNQKGYKLALSMMS